MKRFFSKLLDHPVLTLGAIFLISILFAIPLSTNTRIETNLDKYMPQSNPAFVYSNQAEDWFCIKDGIIIAVESPDGIYNSRTLGKIKSITQDLQQMEEINKNDVTSLYTADNIIGSEFGLEISPFYDKVPSSARAIAELQQQVRQNDMVSQRLVSPDEKVTLIIARLDDNVFSQELYDSIKELNSSYDGPETFHVAGRPIVEGALASLAPADMAKMVPIVILVIIFVLFLVLRSFKSTILTLLVVLLSVLWSFGLMAALNIPVYAVSTMLPVMLIAIGVADGIHMFNHLRIYQMDHPEKTKRSAIEEMLSGMWKPVIITTLTTAAGFISLLSSQVYPIKYFGVFAAFGVLVAMVLSLTMIPAGLMVFGLPKVKSMKNKNLDSMNSHQGTPIARYILRHGRLLILLTIVILGVSIWGTSHIWIDSSFLSQFPPKSDIVQADTYINSKFGGTSTLNVIFDADKPEAFKDPQVLKLLDTIQTDVETSLDAVGNSFSLTDYLKRMNMVMNADDPSFNTIPDSRNLIAQYLLLYEMSGDPATLEQVVDSDYQKANMTFQLKDDSSLTLDSVIHKINTYLPALEKLGLNAHYAGSGYRGLVFSQLILTGQIWSIIISLLLVVILLSIMFHSLYIGLIGSVPILITVFINFGTMGILGIPLSTTTALVSSIAIGIGIDYAVHFIDRYKIYAKETNDPNTACELAMKHSGRAILYNALVVIAGFMVLSFSLFPPNRILGAMVSLNMGTSFLGTLIIIPILLVSSGQFIIKNHKEKLYA